MLEMESDTSSELRYGNFGSQYIYVDTRISSSRISSATPKLGFLSISTLNHIWGEVKQGNINNMFLFLCPCNSFFGEAILAFSLGTRKISFPLTGSIGRIYLLAVLFALHVSVIS